MDSYIAPAVNLVRSPRTIIAALWSSKKYEYCPAKDREKLKDLLEYSASESESEDCSVLGKVGGVGEFEEVADSKQIIRRPGAKPVSEFNNGN